MSPLSVPDDDWCRRDTQQRSPLPDVHTTEGKTGSNFGGGSGNET